MPGVVRGCAILVLALSAAACIGLEEYDRRGLWLTNETNASIFVIERRWGWNWVLAPGDSRAGWVGIGTLDAEVEIRTDQCELLELIVFDMDADTVLVVETDGASTTLGYLNVSMPVKTLPGLPCP